MTARFDPPSGSYEAPVKVTLVGSLLSAALELESDADQHHSASHDSAAQNQTARTNSTSVTSSQNNNNNFFFDDPRAPWMVSIEHIDKIEEIFDGPSVAKHPPQKSIFVYDGPFRVVRAGRTRVCAWPQHGSYETDRIICVYFVENPQDAAASMGWTVLRAPPCTVTHPIASFVPFSFELSATQRYLRPPSSSNSDNNNMSSSNKSENNNEQPCHLLPATLLMSWNYDRQVQSKESTSNLRNAAVSASASAAGNKRAQSPGRANSSVTFAPPQTTFRSQALVKAEVETTWEWIKNIRWSNDGAENIDKRYCIRVSREGGFTKIGGIYGAFDSGVTTETVQRIPVQYDVKPLGAVNAVFGVHGGEDLPCTPISTTSTASSGGGSHHGCTWKDMDCSLHFASLSGTAETKNPEIMFRFYSHHPRPTSVRKPIYEGQVNAGSTMSLRILPDSTATGAGAAGQSAAEANNNNNNNTLPMCEVKLFCDGLYLASGFFPLRKSVKASCLLSDPVAYSALQVVARSPTSKLKINNVFFGAAPVGSDLQDRRKLLQRQIQWELESAKAGAHLETADAAHSDPNCSVVFVDLRVDISPIETSSSTHVGGGSAYVPLAVFWKPTWMQSLPQWSLKILGTAAQSALRLFALESGRGIESFEEADEKNKKSSVMMQL